MIGRHGLKIGSIAFCVWLAFGAVANAKPIPKLTFSDECPKTGSKRACLVVPIEWMWWRDTKRSVYRVPKDNEPRLVLGRLASGAPRVFELTDIGAAAYLGRTAENRPIFLTARGPFEVHAPYIDVEMTAAFFIYKSGTAEVLAHYLRVNNSEYVVGGAHKVGVWDFGRHLCIVAPRRRPGMLSIDPSACRAREPLGDDPDLVLDRRISGAFSYEPEPEFPSLGDLNVPMMESDAISISFNYIARIRGTKYVVADFKLDDACGTDESPPLPFEPLDQPVDWLALRD